MDRTKKNVALLAACQGLLLSNNSLLIATNGLAGFALATDKSLATMPVAAYVIGAALTTMPASLLMRRIGRRMGFTIGACFCILGSLICAYAAYHHEFALLCIGALILGAYNATGQYYRFAAADTASADFKSRAISLVLAGGIIGGFLGPETSKLTKDAIAGAMFTGSYLSLSVFGLIAIGLFSFLDIPPLKVSEQKDPGRPLSVIVRQPAFFVAVTSAVVGYGVMNLLMTATPLAMSACQHPFSAAAFVIQGHVIAMFLPSFFTGSLIARFGLFRIMLIGVLLSLGCSVVALAGLDVANFWIALVLLGVGWNFMFIGGTTLLTEAYTPVERAKVQAANDFLVFLAVSISSFSSGALQHALGWQAVNFGILLPVLAAFLGASWLLLRRRHAKGLE